MPSRFTLGVEIEFVYIYKLPPNVEAYPYSSEDSAYYHYLTYPGRKAVHRALSALDIPLRPLKPHLRQDFSAWTVDGDSTVQLTMEEFQTLPPGYSCEGIELKSRRFDVGRDDIADEIGRVLRTLKLHFNQPRSTARILVNQTCGLHVHIGHRRSGFDLAAVKRLLKLVTVFERQIDALHTASRISIFEDSWCAPPSAIFRRLERDGNGDRHPLHRAAAIDNIGSWDALNEWYESSHHHSAYNFENLMAWLNIHGGPTTYTIEFRQHRGTLNAKEIEGWISVVHSLVAYAEREPPSLFRSGHTSTVDTLIAAHASDPHFSTLSLLAALGVPNSVQARYRAIMNVSYAEQEKSAILRELTVGDGRFAACAQLVTEKNRAEKCRVNVTNVISARFARGDYGVFSPEKTAAIAHTLAQDRFRYR